MPATTRRQSHGESHTFSTNPGDFSFPDGGYGWMCVLGQFLINGFTWGTASAYSVYLSWYLSHQIFPDATPLDFAIIGGLNFAIAVLVGPLANLAVHHWGLRAPMLLGVLVMPAGLIAASFASMTWQLYLSQGFLVGLGIGLVYMPSTTVIPQWFLKRRSLANGISAAGSGVGGCIMCLATQAMLNGLDLAWSFRISAVVVFVVNLVATLLLRSRNAEIQPRASMFNHHLLMSYHVNLLLLWSFTIMFGYIVLMFSLPDFARTIGSSSTASADVAAVLNIGAAVGRPLIGFASDHFGRIWTTAILTFVCSILCFAMWIPTTTYSTLIAFAFISGAILGIFWAAVAPLAAEVVGLRDVPSLLSLIWLAIAGPAIVAEVIALEIRRPGSGMVYLFPQIFAGLSYLIAAVFMFELCRSKHKRSISSPSPASVRSSRF